MKLIITSTMATMALAASVLAGPKKDIVETAVEAGSFGTLVAAAKAAGLVDALKAKGPLTIFAPTDEAFAKLPEGTVESLLKPENKDQLVDILTYHVVEGEVPFKAAVGLGSATALNQEKIQINVRSGGLFLNKARVIENDIRTSNGIIHVIDTVLLPPADNSQAGQGSARGLMMAAIDKGVPLFNHGQHGACADVYEIAARAVVMMSACECADRQVLTAALDEAGRTHCPTTRAWTMRKAIDRVLMTSN